MTAFKFHMGPGLQYVEPVVAALTTTSLNDLDNSVGWSFCVPKTGSITHIGVLVTARVGNPPPYNVGLYVLDASGVPLGYTYGYTTPTTYTFDATGWHWIPLAEPAAANVGQWCGVRIWPGATIPTTSNYVAIPRQGVAGHGSSLYYATSWYITGGNACFTVKYADGTVFGNGFSSSVTYERIFESSNMRTGLNFTVPTTIKIEGVRTYINTTYTFADTYIGCAIYDMTPGSLHSVASIWGADKDSWDSKSQVDFRFAEATLYPNVNYKVFFSLVGTIGAATSFYLPVYTFESAASKAAWTENAGNWVYTTQANGVPMDSPWFDAPLKTIPLCLLCTDATVYGGLVGNVLEYGFLS